MLFQDSSDPTGVSDNYRGSTYVARARSRKANAAVELKLSGANWAQIAEVLGYPTPRAAKVATERALEKLLDNPDDREAMRQLASARLERLMRSVWPKATNPKDPEHLAAVGKGREIVADWIKLHGVQAPSEYVVHTPTQAQLEAFVSTVLSERNVLEVEEYDIIESEVVDEPGAV